MILTILNKLTTKIILCLIALAIVTNPTQALAGTNLRVDCENTAHSCAISPNSPLFHESNMMPGDSVAQTITAWNNSDENGLFALEVLNLRESEIPRQLSEVISIEIYHTSTEGDLLFGPITLKNFFLTPEPHYITLSSINSHNFAQYVVVARFDPAAGNEYQGLTSVFDLKLGFSFIPSPTPAPNMEFRSVSNADGQVAGMTTQAFPPSCTTQAPTTAPVLTLTNIGANDVTLSWTSVSPLTHYALVFTRVSDGAQYGSDNIGTSTSYAVSNLSGGASYRFEVFGVNDCAPGSRSNLAVSGVLSGPFIDTRPTGQGGEVLGVETDQAVPETTGTVLGQAAESASVCVNWKFYIPLIILIAQFFFILSLEYFMRRSSHMHKHYMTIAITLISIAIFYLLKECDCYGDASLLSWVCRWYCPVSVVLTLLLRAISYSFMEEIDEV